MEKGEARPKDLRDLQQDLEFIKSRQTNICHCENQGYNPPLDSNCHSPLDGESSNFYNVIPQVICRDASEFSILVDAIQKLKKDCGFAPDEVFPQIDINMGCPFPMQAKSGRGSGILPRIDAIREILQEVNIRSISLNHPRVGEDLASHNPHCHPREGEDLASHNTHCHPREGEDLASHNTHCHPRVSEDLASHNPHCHPREGEDLASHNTHCHPREGEDLALKHSQNALKFSVKMRLGYTSPEECLALLPLLNEAPLAHITMHPRLGVQQYKGALDFDTFQKFYEGCRHPLIFNGDITSIADIERLEKMYPNLAGVMIGRGLLANPQLAHQYAFQKSVSKICQNAHPHSNSLQALLQIHEALLADYRKRLQGDAQILDKIRPFWTYAVEAAQDPSRDHPDIPKRTIKKIAKARNLSEYLDAIKEIA
ncbi:MAG: tRNA-dihydrouridine synthase family protein [Fibrobacter sp.]|nr:tRNA-dihydrouridine synthase family protein [Fibrobacter sp.]